MVLSRSHTHVTNVLSVVMTKKAECVKQEEDEFQVVAEAGY